MNDIAGEKPTEGEDEASAMPSRSAPSWLASVDGPCSLWTRLLVALAGLPGLQCEVGSCRNQEAFSPPALSFRHILFKIPPFILKKSK